MRPGFLAGFLFLFALGVFGQNETATITGMADKSCLLPAGLMPHTEKLHIVSRFRRPDLGHLETEITFEDPGTFAKPFRMKTVSDLAMNEDVQEWICNENNQDVEHLVGK